MIEVITNLVARLYIVFFFLKRGNWVESGTVKVIEVIDVFQ